MHFVTHTLSFVSYSGECLRIIGGLGLIVGTFSFFCWRRLRFDFDLLNTVCSELCFEYWEMTGLCNLSENQRNREVLSGGFNSVSCSKLNDQEAENTCIDFSN